MERIEVLLADDHPLFLGGVRQLLARRSEDFKITAECDSGLRAIAAIQEAPPQVAVIDIAMPGMNGIDVTKRLRDNGSPVNVIILSVHEERAYVQQALAAGAKGYVLKRSASDYLLHAIRSVMRGGLYLDPEIAKRHVSLKARAPKPNGIGTTIQLTERESEVVRLIAYGFTCKEIANRIGLTTKSIETYKARACEKLEVNSRAKLVEFAVIQGWLQELPR